MALNKRERTLAIATGGVSLVAAVMFLAPSLSGSLGDLRNTGKQLELEVERKETEALPGLNAVAKMVEWESRALPSDDETARSLYETWLYGLAENSGFDDPRVESSEGRSRRGIYTMLPFTLRGRGDLDDLTEFLFGFYSAGHLHKIQRLDVQPMERSSKLDLIISIQTLSLPGADRQTTLSEVPGERLALADLSQYRDAIVDRNLFAPPKDPPPPQPPPREPIARRPDPPPKPPFDHAKHTELTAMVSTADMPEVWLIVHTLGEKLELHEGDTFEVGAAKGTIVHIGLREIEVEIDGQRRLLRRGDTLRGGELLSEGADVWD